MTDNPDGQLAEEIIVLIGQCLGRSHDYALSCMDAERVEILHVADCNTIVIFVPDYLIFNLFPYL